MNVFVTVGTTSFASLVREAISLKERETYNFRIQTADDRYVLEGSDDVKAFYANVEVEYSWADVVVTHSGAGSVYRLLELEKNIVVVPNLERVDKHQKELARYVQDNRFGSVLWDVSRLEYSIEEASAGGFNKYSPAVFFRSLEIAEIIERSLT